MTKRVAVIGAGPAGIATATSLNESSNLEVWLIEKGRTSRKRPCPVDQGASCRGCGGICNVISGVGGCMHPGDALKLSKYPAGRRLHDLLGERYAHYEERALTFFGTDESMNAGGQTAILPRHYDVIELSSGDVYQLLDRKLGDQTSDLAILPETVVTGLTPQKGYWRVTLDSSDGRVEELFNYVVVATGRSGNAQAKEWVRDLEIAFDQPSPSFGIRFELPAGLLRPLYEVHKDYKESRQERSSKVKSFCFSAHPNFGGRIKFCNYQDQFGHELIFLDGHMNAPDTAPESEFGNFGLLAQPHVGERDWEEEFLAKYALRFGGRPFWQPLSEALGGLGKTIDGKNIPSVRDLTRGDIYDLYPRNILNDILSSFLSIITTHYPSTEQFTSIVEQTNILAPCYEFFWDTVRVGPGFETNLPRLYFIGDCAGIAQGNLQAAISGLACADDILSHLKGS